MKNTLCTFIVLASGFTCTFAQQSQAPPAPSAPGPTMEQTIAFINTGLAQDDALENKPVRTRSVELSNGCSLVMTEKRVAGPGNPAGNMDYPHYPKRYSLHLDKTDPRSISISSAGDTPASGASVTISSAIWEELDLPYQVTEPLPGSYQITGVVQSVSESSITIETLFNNLITIPVDPQVGYSEMAEGAGQGTRITKRRFSELRPSIHPGEGINIRRSPYEKLQSIMKEDSVHLLSVNEKLPRNENFAYFHSKDQAERIAKALIHAMVLCHKDQPPSLF
ncbi:hypothetical protein [Paracidobacterium acidisoli]|uniref:Uncharacterized protein n=1 Tax=Paracidobacterium acidisoli TaxID=2303751 RepID=A0A372IUF6_9BACT|nr:hypothetical protein [Paracidobacterium acidisoli]MBT9330008.1 hypothetical protein [Paracidobacterium acidisoli]